MRRYYYYYIDSNFYLLHLDFHNLHYYNYCFYVTTYHFELIALSKVPFKKYYSLIIVCLTTVVAFIVLSYLISFHYLFGFEYELNYYLIGTSMTFRGHYYHLWMNNLSLLRHLRLTVTLDQTHSV